MRIKGLVLISVLLFLLCVNPDTGVAQSQPVDLVQTCRDLHGLRVQSRLPRALMSARSPSSSRGPVEIGF